jgi:hypothetical protein
MTKHKTIKLRIDFNLAEAQDFLDTVSEDLAVNLISHDEAVAKLEWLRTNIMQFISMKVA